MYARIRDDEEGTGAVSDPRVVSVRVRETEPGSIPAEWVPLLRWEITRTYEDGSWQSSYAETEEAAHQWAKRYLADIVPIAGIAS